MVKDRPLALMDGLLQVDRIRCKEVMDEALREQEPLDSIGSLIVPALEKIGKIWEDGEVAPSQVYMAGRICEEIVDELLPEQKRLEGPSQARLALAVLEDQHMLGKRIVYSVLRSAGYRPLDYGSRTVEELVERVAEDDVHLLLLSVLMLPSALRVKELKRQLVAAGLGRVKLFVGGAPFRVDPQLAAEVGADFFGTTASDVLPVLARELQGGSQDG